MADSGLRARYEDGTDLQARSGGLAPQQVVGFQSILVGGAVQVQAAPGGPEVQAAIQPAPTAAGAAVGIPVLGGFVRVDNPLGIFADPGEPAVSSATVPAVVPVGVTPGVGQVALSLRPGSFAAATAVGSPTVQKTFFFPSIYRYFDARTAPGGVDGGDVQTIPNLTSAGSARDATQGTLSKRAIYRATTIGTPSWEFSGGQGYGLGGPRGAPQAGNTVAVLFRAKNHSDFGLMWGSIKGTRPIHSFVVEIGSPPSGVRNAHLGVSSSTKNAFGSFSGITSGLHVVVFRQSVTPPTSGTLVQDIWWQNATTPGSGAKIGTNTVAVNDATDHPGQWMGARAGTAQFLQGYIVGLVEYEAFLSDDDVQSVIGVFNPAGP